MVVNSVNFNKEWAQTVSEEVFVKHFLPVVWPEISEQERKEKLSAAYKLMTVGSEQSAVGSEQSETPKRAKKVKPEATNEGAE